MEELNRMINSVILIIMDANMSWCYISLIVKNISPYLIISLEN